MAVARSISFGQLIRKYSLVIIFPTLTAGAIYADYSHTQRWKAQKALEKQWKMSLIKDAVVMVLPFVGFGIGWYMDRKETERMIKFRDRSALYGRILKPGEQPSWP